MCLGDDCASGAAGQTTRLSLVVLSEGPSSPLRAVDQALCACGTGRALEIAGRSKLGGPPVSPQLGQRPSQARQAR